MSDLIEALRGGEAVLVSTDTVIGLAALPASAGCQRIFELKQRPHDQALPWLVADADALDELACEVPDYARRLARMFWPGALTLVVPASKAARETGPVADDGTVALRCPDDARLLALLAELATPLACTSANVHGEPAARCAGELPAPMRELPGAAELRDGEARQASAIVDCTGAYPRVVRAGAIPEQVLLDVAMYGATLAG